MLEDTQERLAALWNAVQEGDAETAESIRALLLQDWSTQQIDFLLRDYGQKAAQKEASNERANRAQIILVSILAALPTICGGVGFKVLTLGNGYLITSEIERWFGGVIVGALFTLAVFDYGSWCERKFSQRLHEEREVRAWHAVRVWSVLPRRVRLAIALKPQKLSHFIDDSISQSIERLQTLLQCNTELRSLCLLAFVLEQALAAEVPPSLPKARRLQAHLLIRSAERGRRDFWRAVKFEKNLAPTRFFCVIATGCGLLAALDSWTGGIMIAAAIFLLLTTLLPVVSVATIYFPSLIAGIEPAQSSNLAASVRVLMTMAVLASCVLIDLYLGHVGVVRLGLLQLF